MAGTFGGKEIFDPKRLYDYCTSRRVPIPVDAWFTLANSFENPLGRHAGRGYLLMTRSGLNAINLNGTNDLILADGSESVTFKKLIVSAQPKCVTPGARDDPNGMFLVEVADRRHVLKMIPIQRGYNVRAPADEALATDYYSATRNTGADWSWQDMVSHLGSPLGIGTLDLPYTPDPKPENWAFWNGSAWDALNDVLDKLACAVRWDHTDDSFSVVSLGAADTAADAALTAADRDRDWDWERRPIIYGLVPEKARVTFTMLPGPDPEINPLPYYTVDVSAPGSVTGALAGSVAILADDLSAIIDDTNTVTNAAACSTRATERADKYYQALLAATNTPVCRRFSGIKSAAGLRPGKKIWRVKWYDVGGGPYTEVSRSVSDLPNLGGGPKPNRRVAARVVCDGTDLVINWSTGD